jgi:Rieske Fe-S protein
VVTQPTKGQYKAFSAICTHVGCLCNQVAGGTINCPCHGAKFKITDGSVVAGPATTPLATASVTVAGGKIYLQLPARRPPVRADRASPDRASPSRATFGRASPGRAVLTR